MSLSVPGVCRNGSLERRRDDRALAKRNGSLTQKRIRATRVARFDSSRGVSTHGITAHSVPFRSDDRAHRGQPNWILTLDQIRTSLRDGPRGCGIPALKGRPAIAPALRASNRGAHDNAAPARKSAIATATRAANSQRSSIPRNANNPQKGTQ